MTNERTYSKNEIEALSARIIADLTDRRKDIEIVELCMILLYGASYVLWTSQANQSRLLPEVASLAYNYLTSPIPERYSVTPLTLVEDAKVPLSEKGSEVQGSN